MAKSNRTLTQRFIDSDAIEVSTSEVLEGEVLPPLRRRQNKRVLTQRFVDSVKAAPQGKRDRYFDKLTPNFALSVTDKGTKSYAVFMRWPGARNSCPRTIGDALIIGLADARETALEWQRGARRGRQQRRNVSPL